MSNLHEQARKRKDRCSVGRLFRSVWSPDAVILSTYDDREESEGEEALIEFQNGFRINDTRHLPGYREFRIRCTSQGSTNL